MSCISTISLHRCVLLTMSMYIIIDAMDACAREMKKEPVGARNMGSNLNKATVLNYISSLSSPTSFPD